MLARHVAVLRPLPELRNSVHVAEEGAEGLLNVTKIVTLIHIVARASQGCMHYKTPSVELHVFVVTARSAACWG